MESRTTSRCSAAVAYAARVPCDPIAGLRLSAPATTNHIDHDLLTGYRFEDGDGFPDSYRAFVAHVGWARLFGLWLIYPPVLPGYADGWQGRAQNLTDAFRVAYRDGRAEDFTWMVEPDGDWSMVDGLQTFGWSENGDLLLWDTSSRTGDGEFTIWVSLSWNSLHRLGASLREALPVLRTRAAGLFGELPHDAESLQATRI